MVLPKQIIERMWYRSTLLLCSMFELMQEMFSWPCPIKTYALMPVEYPLTM